MNDVENIHGLGFRYVFLKRVRVTPETVLTVHQSDQQLVGSTPQSHFSIGPGERLNRSPNDLVIEPLNC
jgi:hypothetical protein